MTKPSSHLVTQREFARLQKVSPSYVTALRQAGRLVMVGRKVDVDASRRRIKETESGALPHSAVREHWEKERGAPPAPESESGNGDQLIPNTRAYWDRRAAAAAAEMREIELAKMKGDLIPREDVDFVLKDFGAVWRGLLENLPDRLAPQVYPLTTLEDTRAAILEAAEELQQEMADTMKRRMENFGK